MWLELTPAVRHELARDLGLQKTRPSEVESTQTGMRVISDGYSDEELAKITPELLQAYLCCSPELTFEQMWAMAVEKITMFAGADTIEVPVAPVSEPEMETAPSNILPTEKKEVLVKLADPETVAEVEPTPAGSQGLDIPTQPKKHGKAQQK